MANPEEIVRNIEESSASHHITPAQATGVSAESATESLRRSSRPLFIPSSHEEKKEEKEEKEEGDVADIHEKCVTKSCEIFEVDLDEHPEDRKLLNKFLSVGVGRIKERLSGDKFTVEITTKVNQLVALVKLFPKKLTPADIFFISANPNMTLELVKTFPTFAWNWTSISENPNISWDDVIKNPEMKWDYESIIRNPNISWDIIKKNLSIFRRRFVDDEDIRMMFGRNPNAPLEDFEKYFSRIEWDGKPWNNNITWEKIQSNSSLHKILRERFFEYPKCTFSAEIIREVIKINHDKYRLEEYELIFQNMDKVVETNRLDKNDPMDWIRFFNTLSPRLKWTENFWWKKSVSENSAVTLWMVHQFPELFYITSFVRKNPNAYWDEITQLGMDEEQLFNFYLSNPNLTWDIVWRYRKKYPLSQRMIISIETNNFGNTTTKVEKQQKARTISELSRFGPDISREIFEY